MNTSHVSLPFCQHGSNCNTKVRVRPFSDQTLQWKSPFTWDRLSRVLSLLQTSLPNVKSCLGWQMVTLSGSWLSTGEARIQVRTRGGSLRQWRRCGCALKMELVEKFFTVKFSPGISWRAERMQPRLRHAQWRYVLLNSGKPSVGPMAGRMMPAEKKKITH